MNNLLNENMKNVRSDTLPPPALDLSAPVEVPSAGLNGKTVKINGSAVHNRLLSSVDSAEPESPGNDSFNEQIVAGLEMQRKENVRTLTMLVSDFAHHQDISPIKFSQNSNVRPHLDNMLVKLGVIMDNYAKNDDSRVAAMALSDLDNVIDYSVDRLLYNKDLSLHARSAVITMLGGFGRVLGKETNVLEKMQQRVIQRNIGTQAANVVQPYPPAPKLSTVKPIAERPVVVDSPWVTGVPKKVEIAPVPSAAPAPSVPQQVPVQPQVPAVNPPEKKKGLAAAARSAWGWTKNKVSSLWNRGKTQEAAPVTVSA